MPAVPKPPRLRRICAAQLTLLRHVGRHLDQRGLHHQAAPAVGPHLPRARRETPEHLGITQATATTDRQTCSGRRIRVGKLLIASPLPVIAAQITARASGHCEIMAPACTYQQAAIFSRRRRAHPRPLGSPADAIAACRNCIDLIEHTDIPTALDLGYIVDPRSPTSTTAMLWRQHRWVYLDTRGRLHDTADPSLTHTAS